MDRVFLLSIDEVLRFFGDSGMVARGAAMCLWERYVELEVFAHDGLWPYVGLWPSGIIHDQYNAARRAWDLEGSASDWWLRSPGLADDFFTLVGFDGYLSLHGQGVFGGWFRDTLVGSRGVRPALWLYL